MKAQRSWAEVIKSLREQKCQPRLINPAKLSITIDRETKIFHDKTKLILYLFTNSTLQRIIDENSNTRSETTLLKKQESNLSTNLKKDRHKNKIPTLKKKK